MYRSYKKTKEPIHFIGIGGIGMSGIAEVLCRLGFPVSGSDAQESATTQRLKELGVKIHIGHDAAHLDAPKVVVYSSAIKNTNPEFVEAKRRGIPLVPRAEMLAELMRLKYGIGIAGTHGKTSTTSMVGTILMAANLDPTVIVGGKVGALGGNAKLGEGQFIVAEADESDGSFLKLSPVITVITNIDNDHMDFYGNMDHLREAFAQFADKVPYYGRVIFCSDDAEARTLLPALHKPYLSYGFNPGPEAGGAPHLLITEYRTDGEGCRFTITRDGATLCELKLKFPGKHWALNATAAIAVALELDVPLETAVLALDQFAGVGRRFEHKGDLVSPQVRIIDDYGHHPTEIAATVDAARQHWAGKGRVIVAFQPHRFSRTQNCWDQFAPSLKSADHVLLMDIYAAGETAMPGIDSQTLAIAMKQQGCPHVEYSGDVAQTVKKLKATLKDGDLLVTLGAGSVTQLAGFLL
jgi:UDP-N-acetylmuramate--alanine ligase